jgi:hypothetical protein
MMQFIGKVMKCIIDAIYLYFGKLSSRLAWRIAAIDDDKA